MSDNDLKSQWKRLPTAAKFICGGSAALVGLAMLGAIAGDDEDYAEGEDSGVYASQPGGYGSGQGQQGYAGGQGYAQGQAYPQGPGYAGGQGYAGGNGGGGGAYVDAGGVGVNSDAQMAAWEAQQRSQDQNVAQFNQTIREEDTIRDNTTGNVYSGVDASTASAAVDSGAYSSVPTSELPVPGE